MNIEIALKEANILLKKNNIKSYQLDTEILMSNVSKLDRKDFILNKDIELTDEKYQKFKKLIYERSKKKPISYLIKKKEFWKNEFIINDTVLIPRPETEHLVNEALVVTRKKSGNILDLGVGSGCIILSILQERKKLRGIGVDINSGPLIISNINAKKLKIENRVKFVKSDIDNFRLGKYDLIVSNPPYICRSDLNNLVKDVIGYEPKNALNGGNDGVFEIRKVVKKSSKLLKKSGKLVLEIGHNQKDKVIEMLKNNGFFIKKVIKDLGQNNRCITSIKLN